MNVFSHQFSAIFLLNTFAIVVNTNKLVVETWYYNVLINCTVKYMQRLKAYVYVRALRNYTQLHKHVVGTQSCAKRRILACVADNYTVQRNQSSLLTRYTVPYWNTAFTEMSEDFFLIEQFF